MMSKTRNNDLLNVETKIGRPGPKRNHCNTAECASISSSKSYRKKFPISTMLLSYSQPLLGVQLVEAQRSKRRSERRRERLCCPIFSCAIFRAIGINCPSCMIFCKDLAAIWRKGTLKSHYEVLTLYFIPYTRCYR